MADLMILALYALGTGVVIAVVVALLLRRRHGIVHDIVILVPAAMIPVSFSIFAGGTILTRGFQQIVMMGGGGFGVVADLCTSVVRSVQGGLLCSLGALVAGMVVSALRHRRVSEPPSEAGPLPTMPMDALKRSRLRGFAEVILPPLLAMAAFVLLSMLLRAVDLTLLVTDGARRAEAQRVLGTASIAEISRSLGVLLLASTAGGMVLISACAVAFFVLAVFAKGGQTRTAVRMTAWGTVAFVVIATAWGWIRFQRVGELAAQHAARTATSHRAHDEGRQPPPVNMAGR